MFVQEPVCERKLRDQREESVSDAESESAECAPVAKEVRFDPSLKAEIEAEVYRVLGPKA